MFINFFIQIVLCLIFLNQFLYCQETRKPSIPKLFKDLCKEEKWLPGGNLLDLKGSNLDNFYYEISEFLNVHILEEGIHGSFIHRKDSINLSLSVFRFPNQVLAFGFYSRDKSPSLDFSNIGFEAYSLGGRLISWYGTYIVQTETSDTSENRIKLLSEITKDFLKLIPKQKKNLPLLDVFPEKDWVKHSKKFYLQSWLSQKFFQNIYYADYHTQDGYCRIFLINNMSTAEADSNFWKYYSFIKKKAKILNDTLEIDTDYYVVDEPLWGKTILAKKNQMIYGILDYRRKEWAEDRLKEVLDELKKRKIVKAG